MQISAFTKSDEYTICIAMIRMQYEIYNNRQCPLTQLTEVFGCMIADVPSHGAIMPIYTRKSSYKTKYQ